MTLAIPHNTTHAPMNTLSKLSFYYYIYQFSNINYIIMLLVSFVALSDLSVVSVKKARLIAEEVAKFVSVRERVGAEVWLSLNI